MKLAEVSVRRPVFAVMLISAMLVFGLLAYPRVGVDLFPDVEFPVVTVTVVYPGADPATMESKVADKLEESINTLSGIRILQSVNLESVTQVIVQFELDVSIDRAMQDIRDRISSLMRELPPGIEAPQVQKFDVGASPIMSVALSGSLPGRELTALAEDVVKARLQRISGVGAVELVGATEREIQVLVDPAALAGLGLTVQEVIGTLQAQNIELPAGRIVSGQKEISVKTRGEVRSVQEIEDLVIANVAGASIRIGNVARVVDGAEEARSYSSMNGASALALTVRKQSGANTVAVASRVRAELDALRPMVEARGATLSVPTDSAPYIEHSISEVEFDLVFGAVLAIVIILFFLHDIRATLISAVALPTSVIATFAFIDWMGFTFNNMTMLAMSLSIGILIDDAIVVIENIHRHLEMGKSPKQASVDGTREIGLAVLATTFSIVAVFVPVAIMKGLIGRFFFQFGLTVSFAVLVSMLVSFTLTPMLSSRFLHRAHGGQPGMLTRAIEWFLSHVERIYRRTLAWSLHYRFTTLGLAAFALVGSCVLVSQVESEFLPPEDRGQFQIDVEMPTGTSLEATRHYIEAVAKDVRERLPAVEGTFTSIGGGAQGQVNLGNIQVLLPGSKERRFSQQQAMAWVRERFAGVTGVRITVSEIAMVAGGGRTEPIQFNIRGKDMDEVTRAADALAAELRQVEGLVDVDASHRGGKPELAIEPDRARAAALNVPVAAVATTVRALIAGDKVTELKDGQDVVDVVLRLPDAERNDLAGMANLKVRSNTGQIVDLANLVTVTPGAGPSQITREARQRQVTIYANLEGLALGEAQTIVRDIAARVVPPTLTTADAGMGQMMEESFGYMGLALFLAVILVYMILAAQFDSFVHPFTIMLSLPLSVVGAFGALYLTGMTLNIFSMIGVIMLMGLVTKNAILLVDYTNQRREQGASTKDALMVAGPVRLRPILMTTAAMIFGMLPVALALGEGGQQRAPMATCVIGGLITSTLLTLVVVPVVYSLVDGATHSRPVRALGSLIFGPQPPAGRAAGPGPAAPGDSAATGD